MSDDARRLALSRLAAFLYAEVNRDDLPEDLAERFSDRLNELARELLHDDETPVRFMGLTMRARTFLERVGADTVGKLASMDEAERAALPGMGPLYLDEIRIQLARRASTVGQTDARE